MSNERKGAYEGKSVRFPSDVVEWVNQWRTENMAATFGGAVIQILRCIAAADVLERRKYGRGLLMVRVSPSPRPATPRAPRAERKAQ
jgi:hypothetical protein